MPPKSVNNELNLKPELNKNLNLLRDRIKTRAKQFPEAAQAPELLINEPNDSLFVNGPPVGPREFIDANEFGGDGSLNVVFPWVKDVLEEIFSGKYHAPKYQTAAIIAGKGSGKSYLSGWMLAYLWYWFLSFKDFGKYLLETQGIHYDTDSTTAFVGMAPTDKQARRIVFDYCTKALRQVKYIREKSLVPDPKAVKELRYNVFDETFRRDFTKLLILPGNSSQSFTLGYNIFAGVIDEATFWKEKHFDPAEDLYNEMRQRQFSRFKHNGIIMLISSANIDGDFVEQLEHQAAEDPGIYFKRLSLYDCRPEYKGKPTFELKTKRERADGSIEEITLHPPLELKPLYDHHLIQTLRDVDSIPSVAGKPFYPDYMLLLSRINKSRIDPAPDKGKDFPEGPMDIYTNLPPNFRGLDSTTYHVHVDLAKGSTVKGHCGCGFAMCHKQADGNTGYKIVLDIAARFKTPSDKDISVSEVLEFIKMLKTQKGFNICKVTFDKWNSLQPIQTVNGWNMGIIAEELSVGYKEHTYLKTIINTNQFDFYEDSNLLYELKRLEDYQTTVEHAAGAFKDEADAVAGAAFSAAELQETKEVIKPRAICGALARRGSPMMGGGGNVPAYRQASPQLGKYRQNAF